MTRDQLEIIDKAYTARTRGDVAALSEMWAEDATFEIAGDNALLDSFPVAGRAPGQPTVEAVMALVAMTSAVRLHAVVEGHHAAVISRATMAFGWREPFETLLYDLFELDETGRIRSLLQFVDTAKVAGEMHALTAT